MANTNSYNAKSNSARDNDHGFPSCMSIRVLPVPAWIGLWSSWGFNHSKTVLFNDLFDLKVVKSCLGVQSATDTTFGCEEINCDNVGAKGLLDSCNVHLTCDKIVGHSVIRNNTISNIQYPNISGATESPPILFSEVHLGTRPSSRHMEPTQPICAPDSSYEDRMRRNCPRTDCHPCPRAKRPPTGLNERGRCFPRASPKP